MQSMHVNGKSIAHECPARQGDGDLAEATFNWDAHEADTGPNGQAPNTEMLGYFTDGANEIVASTDSVVVGTGSHLSRKAYQVGEGDETAQAQRRAAMQRGFCELALQCQGAVNGECGALGEAAVKRVLEQIIK